MTYMGPAFTVQNRILFDKRFWWFRVLGYR